jgi:hypothetical protein
VLLLPLTATLSLRLLVLLPKLLTNQLLPDKLLGAQV